MAQNKPKAIHPFFGSAGDMTKKAIAAQEKREVPDVLPWIEKYRPKKVRDIAYQKDIVEVLSQLVAGKDFPHLLFYGPPGTGKTSAILALCREMFHTTAIMKDRVLELNASDERGIDVVRRSVKGFAQISVSSTGPGGVPLPPFKIIIMDEADAMTTAAQAALRRIIEQQSKTTRFCLICNYVSKIIEPLGSRCAKFRFKPLPDDIMANRLRMIAEGEGLVDDYENLLPVVTRASGGDMRRAVTLFQTLAVLVKAHKGKEHLVQSELEDLTGHIPNKLVTDFLELCKRKREMELYEFVKNDIILTGYSIEGVIYSIHEIVMSDDPETGEYRLSYKTKASICQSLGLVESRLAHGSDDELEMLYVANIMKNAM